MYQDLNPNKTYFAVSDIHSFYGPLQEALNMAGFARENEDHVLIVCGDIFDRGPDTLKVYKFLKELPKERRILIRGNHEQLLLDLVKSEYPSWVDYSNGTLNTFCHIVDNLMIIPEYFIIDRYWGARYPKEFSKYWKKSQKIVRNSEVVQWLKSDEWVDFLELSNYIFVHSFIPVKHMNYEAWDCKDTTSLQFLSNWRQSSKKAWNRATWGCPYLQFDAGLFDKEIKKAKVLVCGHWHTRDFHTFFKTKGGINDQIYFSKNLIGLDGRTAGSLNINVLVIKDNKCFNKFGKELTNG